MNNSAYSDILRELEADTSLAADTARRMGVTFDDLADLLTRRFGVPRERSGYVAMEEDSKV